MNSPNSLLRSIRRFILEGKRLPTYLGIFSVVFVLWLHQGAPVFVDDFIERLEFLVYDQRLTIMPKAVKSAENKIVIVDLDERSLQAEGQYPWNRIKVGQLTEKLRDNGVLVVGFDITFPEPDRNIRDLLAPIDLDSLDPIFAETLRMIEPQIDADQYFANSMSGNIDVVLAINFNPQSTVSYNELPASIVDIGEELASRITVVDMTGFTGNLKVLQDAARGNGSMNQRPDADGIVRRVPLIIRYGSDLYPTLSLEMVRVYNFAEGYELLTAQYSGLDVVTGVRIGRGAGAFVIPTDGFGQVNVPYVGTSSLNNNNYFTYVSATDVLNDNLDDDEKLALQNSLVLVGTSAPGLGDIRAMPLQQVYPGVEVHANMLNALLDSVATVVVDSGNTSTKSVFESFQPPADIYFPYKPDWEAGALLVVMMTIGLAMSVAFPYLGAASMAVTSIALVALSVWTNFQLWTVYKFDFSLVLLLLLIVLVTTVNMVYGFLNESRTRKTIKGMFDQYVPPAHIDSMLEDPDNYSFEGESKELTVLFFDIRDFTTISEALSATELKILLNDVFTPLTAIIFENNGTIDKYVGDMVMAFWGAPLEDKKHRSNAVKAALIMLKKIEELRPEFKERGYPVVNGGIGLNTGIMSVGDMGSVYRRSYTVLGDSVNLGARLEGLTKFYGIKLLVGEKTIEGLEGFLLRRIDRVKVKGKNKAVDCYEPMCLIDQADDELKSRVDAYHKALDLYYAKEWNAAENGFKALLENEPDTKLYNVYLDRIETLKDTPLAEDWDGSFTHTSK
ncbi:MAG: adenylate/guanylate cyclase domain-containing protein [SAR86 cluster bacterium]|uniref:Adenylate/guanylate cyclase domain-containing protein n=1 Tax=SAR86 cluster bacterium TaxID=2030880 RepID=A0A2A5BAR9_9GAMM|nr:MAG: adenylate/guanylate cyclase domain-containing protein [SAR86 cluster bacterium]